ncbi:hypothetical protein GGI19_003496 [Coemansia pectinata]|uniref:Uncharacterized protein n=1 Tax=Coemansia pectinata TaxID=1052879 RepID=A0A9W8GU62_9FUNG|nr:hypothetical protein GGI19_003496 [Coemansia pectinata]
MSAATETVRPSLADIGMQTDDVFIRSGTLTVDPCTCPDPPQTRDIAAVSEHCHSTEDSYNAEHSYDGKGPYSAYPVTVDCGDGDDGYCISSTERKWFDRARLEYSFDILERLSDSQLETLYSAYHALRDWHSGLPLDDDQHMALLRVCLIADKYRSRGELATPTTLLTSMAFRHTDKDDILGTIPRLVVEYYSEQ